MRWPATLGGILGILLAAPTIAGARTLGGCALRKIFDQDPFAEPETPDRRQLWGELVQKRSSAAILFDIDGTLVETDGALASPSRTACPLARPDVRRAGQH